MIRRLVPDVAHQTGADAADAIATALCHLFGQATTEALARAGVLERRSR
jgi:Holliday junction resolvasome RuvABC endonuclease subunit